MYRSRQPVHVRAHEVARHHLFSKGQTHTSDCGTLEMRMSRSVAGQVGEDPRRVRWTGWLRLVRYTVVLLLLLIAGCAIVAPGLLAAQSRPIAPPAPQTLDLSALEAQLRATKAIGIFTKISLKNQVDDLIKQFRDHYAGQSRRTMTELRRSYDLLIMKVLSLLQDTDQTLASAIVSSREVIWGLLSDQNKFANL
jgi:hypothetical protein